MKITFVGHREKPFNCKVNVITSVGSTNGVSRLPLFSDEINHSPTGFEWGYGGSGPAQLAYAILRRYFNIKHDDKEAERLALLYYGDFKWDIVAKFPLNGFVLQQNEIEFWFRKRLRNKAYRSIILGEKE